MRYEIFVIQHVLSFAALITCIMIHVPSYAKVYVWLPVGLYLADRVVRTFLLVWRNFRFRKGFVRCRAIIKALPGQATRVVITNPPLNIWRPGQHLFLHLPALAPFQSHPFTIASTPESNTLTFIIRAHKGFSRKLYNRAAESLPSSPPRTIAALIDGPYGNPPRFEQFDTLVLIAGSTGITFTLPILLSALQAKVTCVRRIHFIWTCKMGGQFEWVASEIEQAVELAGSRDVELDIGCCVTRDPDYNYSDMTGVMRWKKCKCSGNPTGGDSATPADQNLVNEKTDALSTTSSVSSLLKCNCSDPEKKSISVTIGRPDLRKAIDRDLSLAWGDTGN
jgi:ferric-chelate reductase